MPVTAALLLGLVPDEVVDEPLVNSLARQGRDEAVPQDVPAAHYLPLAVLHGSFEAFLSRLGRQHLFASAEQEWDSFAILHPGRQHFDGTRAERDAAGCAPAFDAFFSRIVMAAPATSTSSGFARIISLLRMPVWAVTTKAG